MNKIKKISLLSLGLMSLGSSFVNSAGQPIRSDLQLKSLSKVENTLAETSTYEVGLNVYTLNDAKVEGNTLIYAPGERLEVGIFSVPDTYESFTFNSVVDFDYVDLYLLQDQFVNEEINLNEDFSAEIYYDDMGQIDFGNITSFNTIGFIPHNGGHAEDDFKMSMTLNGYDPDHSVLSATYNTLVSEGVTEESIAEDFNVINYFAENGIPVYLNEFVYPSNSTLKPDVVGSYGIQYEVNDVLGNQQGLGMTVNILDGIIGDQEFDLYIDVDDNLTAGDIKSLFNAEDVFGTPVEVELQEGSYNLTTPGLVDVIYTATDEWGNKATLTVHVNVVSYRPIVELEDGNTIRINYSDGVTLEDIQNLFTVKENDGTLIEKPRIVWNKLFNNSHIGSDTYSLKFYSKKMPEKYTEFELTIDVTQDVPPTFMVVSDIAFTSSDKPLDAEALKDLVAYFSNTPKALMSDFEITNYVDYVNHVASREDVKLAYSFTNNQTNEKVNDEILIKFSEKGDGLEMNFFEKHFDYYFNYILMPNGFEWENFGDYLLYFVCFGWIWMPLVNWEV